jgi:hypothetical protein
MTELLLFDDQIERKFLTSDVVYKSTCGSADCKFTCEVPHLSMIVRVRGQDGDQIGITLNTPDELIENMLPKVPGCQYSYRTWRNSRFHIIRRMLLTPVPAKRKPLGAKSSQTFSNVNNSTIRLWAP